MKTRVADYETLVDDVRDLRAFALVCDLESVTAAADLMGESKATTSRRITRLETALGTALLRRSPRAVEPTDEGTSYRARVAHVLELLGDANALAKGARATPSGQLRVTSLPGLNDTLAPALAQFSAAFADVAVSVHIGSRFVDIEAEQFDVAVRGAAKLPDSSLVAHRVDVDGLDRIVVAAPSYLATHRAPRRPEDLAAHRVVAAKDATTMSSVVFTRQGKEERVGVDVPISMASTDIGLVRDIAVAGAGVSILPRMLVERQLDTGRLVHLLPGLVVPGLSLYLIHRGGRFVPPKVKAFVDFMKQALAGQSKSARARR
jgi:DNA-binding transcriptional LysR family regulator